MSEKGLQSSAASREEFRRLADPSCLLDYLQQGRNAGYIAMKYCLLHAGCTTVLYLAQCFTGLRSRAEPHFMPR
jgi:hypothetical protein